MNNVILAIFEKGKYGVEDYQPRIIYANWVTFSGNKMYIMAQKAPNEEISMKNVDMVSVVGQFDKDGKEWHHYYDDTEK